MNKLKKLCFHPAKICALLLLLCTVVLSSGCFSARDPHLKPPISRNTIERPPSGIGHRIDVTNFRWRYIDGGRALEVVGDVVNRSGRNHRPVVLYCMLFDETGKAVGVGEARVVPEFLPSGATGSFVLLVAAGRPQKPKPIRYIRILTNAQNS